MPPHISALALALLTATAPRALAQTDTDPVLASRAATQQAVGAYQAHDVPGFLRYAIEAERLRPTTARPSTIWPAPAR